MRAIAKRAGVSGAIVSRVINGSPPGERGNRQAGEGNPGRDQLHPEPDGDHAQVWSQEKLWVAHPGHSQSVLLGFLAEFEELQ
jgi:hypothetical protein